MSKLIKQYYVGTCIKCDNVIKTNVYGLCADCQANLTEDNSCIGCIHFCNDCDLQCIVGEGK